MWSEMPEVAAICTRTNLLEVSMLNIDQARIPILPDQSSKPKDPEDLQRCIYAQVVARLIFAFTVRSSPEVKPNGYIGER